MLTKTRVHVLLAAALAASLIACGIKLPGPKPPDPPPVEPVLIDVLVRLHDGGNAVAGAQFKCNQFEGFSDGAGELRFSTPEGRQVDCAFNAEGYETLTASLLPGPDRVLDWQMQRVPSATPVSENATVGRLKAGPDSFSDETGKVLPLYAHAGDLFSLYVRDEARALRELDDVARAGYRGVRVWSTLGCRGGPCNGSGYWAGREVGPQLTEDYWGKLERFADALRARGLRAVWSQGDVAGLSYNGGSRRAYMERLAALDNAKPFVDFLDCGNEAWQTGEPDPARLAECVGYYRAAGGQAILSLTSPPGETADDLNRYSIPPAQVYDVHSWRDGHWYDKRRHIFSIGYEQPTTLPLGIGSEPPGNGVLVSASENKHELDNEAVPLLAVSSMLARQAFVWFSGEGVKINEGLHTQAGFWTTPRAVAWLPRDVMSFYRLHHSGDRWKGTRVLAAVGEGRADCRTNNDGRFACTLDGPTGTYRWPVERGFSGQLCHPEEGTCIDVAMTAGATLDTTFMRGRVLVGRVQ